VDIQLVCATHRNLREMMADGSFRQDLYYRLNVIEIVVPPLRERRDDLPALCTALLGRIAHESGMRVPPPSGALLAELQQHPLAGNVRELENLLHRAVAMSEGDELSADFPDSASQALAPLPAGDEATPSDLQAYLDRQERAILVRVLHETGFNRTAAAARLGLSLRQIRYRIARLNIATPQDNEPHDE
jgi:two-component system response regulator PilR (NtrC family)